ncbi:MAG: hypothetical protein Q6K59_04075 [Gloeomargarita sp. GMQP_bins_25]
MAGKPSKAQVLSLVVVPFVAYALPVCAQGIFDSKPVPSTSFSVSPEVLRSIEINPPADLKTHQLDGSAILSHRTLSDQLPRLGIQRQFNLSSLRQQPILSFGLGRLNFQPFLNDPKAPFNVAQKLRALPNLATVQTDTTTVWEVRDGMVIHTLLRYELKPGACTNPASRRQVEQAGVACASRLSESALEARNQQLFREGTGRPGPVHDWSLRQREWRAKQLSALRGYMAQLRAYFQDPTQRARMVQNWGQAEVQRLAALDDEALMTEMANSSETVIEQVMFIPVKDQLDWYIPGLKLILKTPDFLVLQNIKLPQKDGVSATSTAHKPTTQALPERYFLTGFTLGREYEWRRRIEKTIKWCWLGCAETYFAEAYAQFRYGLGLRFPIKTWGTYSYLGQDQAEVTVNFSPVNGHEGHYLEAGLPKEKLFQGKEIVAEASAKAGLAVKFPIIGTTGVHPSLEADFTQYLPGIFSGGQLTPPAPGNQTLSQTTVIEQIDFLGNSANFGVIGAKVHPVLALAMQSGSLTLKLVDNLAGGSSRLLTASGLRIPLKTSPADQSSSFSLGDPVYEVSFIITPGINAKLFLDLAVWSTSWDQTILFPQLEIRLPPDGLQFACHAQTKCSRIYTVGPQVVKVQEFTPSEKAVADVMAYYKGYGQSWLKKCYDGPCVVEVANLVIQMMKWVKTYAENKPDADWKAFNAQVEAGYMPLLQKVVKDSQARTGGVKKI